MRGVEAAGRLVLRRRPKPAAQRARAVALGERRDRREQRRLGRAADHATAEQKRVDLANAVGDTRDRDTDDAMIAEAIADAEPEHAMRAVAHHALDLLLAVAARRHV